MPRPTLPHDLKKLKTYTTLLTQTKEEDLWKHFTCGMERYLKFNEKKLSVLRGISNELYEGNPYSRESWRKGYVKRLYNKDAIHDYISFSEDDMEEQVWCLHFMGDLKICNRALKWDEDEEYSQEYVQMDFELERTRGLVVAYYEEIEMLDHIAYTQARNNWFKDHEEELTHEKYHSRGNYKDGCSFCSKAKEREDKHREYVAKQEEEAKVYAQEQQRKEEQHKRGLHCSACSLQTRSPSEFNNHLQTLKHKKAVGEYVKEEKVFRCEACDYSSTFKHVYEAHLKSKKHITLAGEQPS